MAQKAINDAEFPKVSTFCLCQNGKNPILDLFSLVKHERQTDYIVLIYDIYSNVQFFNREVLS